MRALLQYGHSAVPTYRTHACLPHSDSSVAVQYSIPQGYLPTGREELLSVCTHPTHLPTHLPTYPPSGSAAAVPCDVASRALGPGRQA